MKKLHIFAIIAAILTAVAVYLFLMNINTPAVVQTTSVVIASENIPANTIITSGMVETAEYPAEAVLKNTARNIGDVVGKTSDGDIVAGEQMITSKLIAPGEDYDTLAYAIEEGQRAFTVAVDDVSGVAGLLRPRDRIDILVTISVDVPVEGDVEGATINRTYSVQLLQNIEILAVGQVINESELDGSGYSTVTLSVTPEQAVQLNLAVERGQIRLILRSPLDSKTTTEEIITVDALLE